MKKLITKLTSLSVVLVLLLSACGYMNNEKTHIPDKENQVFIWKESTPVEQGISAEMATNIDNGISKNYPNIYSFLIVRHGAVIYERYYQGKTKDSLTHIFSVTKSVTSSLIGIALKEGYIKSIDQKISEFLPEYFMGNTDQLKKEITIRDGLKMTGGLEPTDDTISSWTSSKDWFKYAIDLPLKAKPGEKFIYNTGLTHLLSGVLTKATKMSTKDFAQKYLFNPLNITNFKWDTDSMGYYSGGHLLYMTPRDIAKFGYLYLNHGNWSGKQVVPKDWVNESTKKKVELDNLESYGYLWWLSEERDSKTGKRYFEYSARGYGSQHIIVIPDLDMVIAITSNPDMKSNDSSDTSEIVGKYIIPAVKKAM